jgi:hypothetical protein
VWQDGAYGCMNNGRFITVEELDGAQKDRPEDTDDGYDYDDLYDED